MVKILRYPKTKLVRIFDCKCGCTFQADFEDFTVSNKILTNDTKTALSSALLYGIVCPFCKTYSVYDDTNSHYQKIWISDNEKDLLSH